MSKFTSGPWKFEFNSASTNDTHCIEIRSPLGWLSVASLQSFTSDDRVFDDREETIANARLIAAAPELLDALENLVHWNILRDGEDDMPLSDEYQTLEIRDALSIIRKARGDE